MIDELLTALMMIRTNNPKEPGRVAFHYNNLHITVEVINPKDLHLDRNMNEFKWTIIVKSPGMSVNVTKRTKDVRAVAEAIEDIIARYKKYS